MNDKDFELYRTIGKAMNMAAKLGYTDLYITLSHALCEITDEACEDGE